MELKYSFSMRQTFQVCPRKTWFRYVAGIEDDRTRVDSRIVGKTFHRTLELMRFGTDRISALTAAYEALSKTERPEVETAKIDAYVSGYFLAFDDLARPLKTEIRLEAGDDIGYVDCMADLEDGSKIIIEDKTATILDPNLEMALTQNDQIATYLWLCAENGIDVSAVMYRETQKSVHKVNKGESVSDFAARIMSLYTNTTDRYRQIAVDPKNYDNRRTAKTVKAQNQAIYDFLDANVYAPDIASIPKNAWSCLGKYGACEFLPLCSGCCDPASRYKPNDKEPLDGGEFMIRHGFARDPKFDPSELDDYHALVVDGDSDLHRRDMIDFISCFDIGIDRERLKKIVELYFKMPEFELKMFIKKHKREVEK